MPKLVIVRGIPGSGKSTIAKKLFPKYLHCEADQYFEGIDGGYNWKASEVPNAHAWCQSSAMEGLSLGMDVIVTNTFVRKQDMKPYLDMAEKFNAEVTVIIANSNFKDIHNVPESVVEHMRNSFEY